MGYRIAAIAFAAAITSTASAQTDRSFQACPSQQTLQQVIGSENRFIPDDCPKLTITRIKTNGTEVCVLDFGRDGDPGFLDQLKRAAIPQQWWVSCSDLDRR
jgi:hypothetical protein